MNPLPDSTNPVQSSPSNFDIYPVLGLSLRIDLCTAYFTSNAALIAYPIAIVISQTSNQTSKQTNPKQQQHHHQHGHRLHHPRTRTIPSLSAVISGREPVKFLRTWATNLFRTTGTKQRYPCCGRPVEAERKRWQSDGEATAFFEGSGASRLILGFGWAFDVVFMLMLGWLLFVWSYPITRIL